MAVTFDGPNLIITLESGVTTIEWIDVYSDWKRWVSSSDGHKYEPAFRTVGGDPLSAVINAGAYFFLRNDLGWRIKPPEEDITIFALGNLALEDTEGESILPTTGAFTAAILGLQPVTQGVVPQMRAQLAVTSYNGVVAFDPSNRTGNATAGTGTVGNDEIGTRRLPSDNTDDVKTISDDYGLASIQVLSNFTGVAETTDFSLGYTFIGDSTDTQFNANSGLDLTNCAFNNLTLTGPLDGVNQLEDCNLAGVTDFSGDASACDIDGDIAINGKVEFIDCYSGKEGLGYGRLTSIAADTVIVRRMNGSIGLADMSGGTHSIGVYGGRIIIEASCTGGTIYARGEPYEITDLSGGAVTVVNQTDSEKVTQLPADMLEQSIVANEING